MSKRASRLRALACACALVSMGLVSCSQDANNETESPDVREKGSIQLPLETVTPSGNVYRLRNARFRVNDVRTGERVITLRSEDEPFGNLLTAELDAGNYTVTLLEDWFIERVVSNSPGSGGSGPVPVPFPEPGAGGASNFPDGAPPSDAGIPVDPDEPPDDDTADDDTADDIADDDSADDDLPDDGPVAPTGVPSPPRPPSTSPPPDGFGEIVDAILVSDTIQFASVLANEDTFVSYVFRVGDDVLQFGPGRLHVQFDVIEDEDPCQTAGLDPRRTLFETNVDAVSQLSMREVFDSIAGNGMFPTPADELYGQIIDSYATADQANLPDAIHCGDETTNGSPSLNGFPITCNRIERLQFSNLDLWFPTAVVNRIDLAPQNGAHCGQQRLMFANNSQGRMFFIFEAQIPNPVPELGFAGCLPLAEFWASLNEEDDPVVRGARLRDAFVNGEPSLQAAGFGPFLEPTHFTVGTGQIRTNNFDDFPWTLREFKLSVDGSNLRALPFPVAEAPNGQLWNDLSDSPQGPECRAAFIDAVGGLLSNDPAEMSFVVPHECKDAESRNDGSQNYSARLNEGDPGGFRVQLEAAIAGTGLTANQVARRAQFAGSCIGCHEEAVGADLGLGVTAPFSNGFVHVNEFFTEPCDGGSCFSISPALADVFLPHRREVLSSLVDVALPPECQPEPPIGVDGGVGMTPSPTPNPTDPPDLPPVDPLPAPELDVSLPDSDTPSEQLLELDSQMREQFGDKTIGGQSAQQSH